MPTHTPSMFTKRVHTEIEIDAAPLAVWRVLVDFDAYPEWNPMVRHAAGTLRAGERLRLEYRPEGRRARTFRPRLRVVEPGHELSWKGQPEARWLMESIHSYRFRVTASGRTHLDHDMVFWGALTPLLQGVLEAGSRAPFAAQNQALKQRVESLVASDSGL